MERAGGREKEGEEQREKEGVGQRKLVERDMGDREIEREGEREGYGGERG